MDHSRRGEGQNEPQVDQLSHSRYPLQVQETQGSAIASGTGAKSRPTLGNISTSTPRSMGVSGSYNNYYQDSPSGYSAPAMSSNVLAYGGDYGGDTRASGPGYGNYNTSMEMYNVPHTATQQSVYDTQQFTPRQHTAIQMMPSDVASTYFATDGAGAAATPQATGQSSGTPSSVFQQQVSGMSYSSSMSNVNEIHQQSGGSNATASDSRDFQADEAMTEKWASYQRQLGSVFEDITCGQLERASESLLSVSNWLLTQVVELGLHQDDTSLHDDRIKLWDDFNHAWLALAFQQKEHMSSGSEISKSHRLMSESTIRKMGDELVRLCDGVERHGLVDYQYGVWEEQIEALLEACLDRFETTSDNSR